MKLCIKLIGFYELINSVSGQDYIGLLSCLLDRNLLQFLLMFLRFTPCFYQIRTIHRIFYFSRNFSSFLQLTIVFKAVEVFCRFLTFTPYFLLFFVYDYEIEYENNKYYDNDYDYEFIIVMVIMIMIMTTYFSTTVYGDTRACR